LFYDSEHYNTEGLFYSFKTSMIDIEKNGMSFFPNPLDQILDMYYRQNYKITTFRYKCQTFSNAIGIFGGEASVVLWLLLVLMQWYSRFQNERSIIK